jgi:hypothetical protein
MPETKALAYGYREGLKNGTPPRFRATALFKPENLV